MAKDVYRNASLEAISILRAVNDAEKRQRSFYEGIDEINQVRQSISFMLTLT